LIKVAISPNADQDNFLKAELSVFNFGNVLEFSGKTSYAAKARAGFKI
jgi:hypothetical protein